MGHYNPEMLPKIDAPHLLAAIRGMPCTLRISSFIPGHKCAGIDTVVPCHLRTIGKGMGTKVSDLFVVAGCIHCHDILDGRDANRAAFLIQNYPTAVMERQLRALCETQSMLVAEGIIQVSKAVQRKGAMPA